MPMSGAAAAATRYTSPLGRWSVLQEFAGNPWLTHDLATVADLIASAGDGTNRNTGALASAAIASSVLTTTHVTSGASNWWSGTYTGAVLGWTVPRIGVIGIEAHIKYPDAEDMIDDEFGGAIAVTTGATTNWIYSIQGRASSAFHTSSYRGAADGDGSPDVPTQADLIAGHWHRVLVFPDGRASTYYYQSADAATLPTEADWTHQRTDYAYFGADNASIDFGIVSVSNQGTPSGQRMQIGALNILYPARTVL